MLKRLIVKLMSWNSERNKGWQRAESNKTMHDNRVEAENAKEREKIQQARAREEILQRASEQQKKIEGEEADLSEETKSSKNDRRAA